MESNKVEQPTERTACTPTTSEGSAAAQSEGKPRQAESPAKTHKCKKGKAKEDSKLVKKAGKSKKQKEAVSSDEETESESSESPSDVDTDSTSESSSDSETERERRKRKSKEKRAKAKAKDRKKSKLRRRLKREESSDSSSDEDSEAEESEETEEQDIPSPSAELEQQVLRLQMQQQLQSQQLQAFQPSLTQQQAFQPPLGTQQQHFQVFQPPLAQQQQLQSWAPGSGTGLGLNLFGNAASRIRQTRNAKHLASLGLDGNGKKLKKEKKPKKKRGSKLEYKRVDQLWDNTIHNYKLQDTAEDEESSEYDHYLFNVRRTFDWEGKYKTTVVDIKSKLLKEVLNDVMDGVKGVSLVEETPVVDPNLLFLYLDDLREFYKVLKAKAKGGEKMKRKAKKRTELKIKHLKVLLKYLDKDYAEVKKTLYPMLESGLISFDLLWALYKPNTLAYTTTYGTADEPRAFKIEYAEKEFSFVKGEWYNIEGRYLEYDGKTFGVGQMEVDVPSFKGARKITSLSCYPLKFHKDEAKLRRDLIERGKKFVALQGVHYKSHEGLAYYKKKRQVIKVNINGRVMVDPAIHRRILPNYQISTVKPKDPDEIDSPDSDESESEEGCGCGSSDDQAQGLGLEELDEQRTKLKVVLDDKKKPHLVEVPIDADGEEIKKEKLEELPSKDADGRETSDKKAIPVFTDEEFLIASPVVLGFAFAEKLWLEFTVSGIKDIVWNEGAYESLVLEDNTKEIVKALVESHKYHPAESIDDVIQGKGKGLVAVLHGPPGTGKTLTAEGISEFLKCPLYMVSAGELGTDPRTLEGELQKILDIAHAWGALLLLDEADVFLEKRTIQDIHRNALVSIFLRLLEYFQGILFLTTNRVETFDDAFQSRIHIALRYGELSTKAKRSVFKMFIERVRVLEGVETMPFKEEDYDSLAKHNLNGRQIKNTIRTAKALAVNKKEPLSMEHIRRVLDVLLAFDRDLKGGTGYIEAMRSYY